MKSDNKKLSHKSRLGIIKIVIVLAGVLLLLAPAGSSTPQVNMYSMVTSMGIDKGENGVKCTAEVILPVENSGAKGESIIIQGEGSTLPSAIENLSMSLGRTLDISHCALFVVGRDKAQEGVLDELNFLLSAGTVSPEMNVVLSGNKDAAEFLHCLNSYGEKLDLDNLIKYMDYGAHNFSQTLLLFLNETYSKSATAVIPCITMGETAENRSAIEGIDLPSDEKNSEESDSKKEKGSDESGGNSGESSLGSSNGSGSDSGSKSEEKKVTVVSRTEKIGIFKNGRLSALWGAKEAGAISMRDIKTKNGHFILRDVQVGQETLDKISCYLVKKKLKTCLKIENGNPVLFYKIHAQFLIEERYKVYCAGEVGKSIPKTAIEAIKRELEIYLLDSLTQTLEKSREDDCDALLVADYFYKYHPRRYKEFVESGKNILQNASLKVDFDFKIN